MSLFINFVTLLKTIRDLLWMFYTKAWKYLFFPCSVCLLSWFFLSFCPIEVFPIFWYYFVISPSVRWIHFCSLFWCFIPVNTSLASISGSNPLHYQKPTLFQLKTSFVVFKCAMFSFAETMQGEQQIMCWLYFLIIYVLLGGGQWWEQSFYKISLADF